MSTLVSKAETFVTGTKLVPSLNSEISPSVRTWDDRLKTLIYKSWHSDWGESTGFADLLGEKGLNFVWSSYHQEDNMGAADSSYGEQ